MKTLPLFLCLWLAALSVSAAPTPRADFNWSALDLVAIQDRGRIKPLETFALESVRFLTGKSSWKGMRPLDSLFGWLIAFDKEWENEPFIRVDYGPLKTALGLPTTEKYFSPKQLGAAANLRGLVRDAMQRQQDRERLSDLDKKVMQLQNQRGLLDAIVSGQAWNILPNPEGIEKGWFSLASLTDGTGLPYAEQVQVRLGQALKSMLTAYLAHDPIRWNEGAQIFAPLVRNELAPGKYPAVETLKRENFFNRLRPFHWAWILYTLAFVCLLIFNVGGARGGMKAMKYAGGVALICAFVLHAGGFLLRCAIAGRPPVTNMYESIVWVTWGCVLFSLVIWVAYKNAVIPNAAVVFAIVGLILADNLPLVLDPSIQPLEPVLRSNYWLTIHVLTITLSYAAFALSLCLGNVVLGHYIFRPARTQLIQQNSLYMYRAVQIGVVLLAAGTILGGVWADYSWGRFWGWDPKEVWALIALLLYLAVLHGRFTGWLRGFGFVATTVISFLGVLMAWYGVNFVLGVGLHSYGFGTGGMGYVVAYVLAQLAFIGAAYVRYAKTTNNSGGAPAAIFPRGAR